MGVMTVGGGNRLNIGENGILSIKGAGTSWAGYDGSNDGANQILTLSGIGLQNPNNLIRLSDTKAVLGFEDINNSSFYTAVVLDVGATTVTENSLFVLHSISSNPTVSMQAVSDTVFTTVHKNVAGIASGGIFASTWTVSGSTISAGDTSNALSTVTGPQFNCTARRFGTGAWVGIADDGLVNERTGSEAYTISGSTVTTAQGTYLGPGLGGSGGSSGPPRSWGGVTGQSAEGRDLGGSALPGNRVAFQYDAPSIADTVVFMTNSGGSTSAGSGWEPETNLPGSSEEWQFGELRDDPDKVFCVYNASGGAKALSGAILGMTGNNVTTVGTQNTLSADEWWYDKSIIKTAPDEAFIFGGNRDTDDTAAFLVTATDDNTMSADTPVVFENGASRNSWMMIQMNINQFLAVWADGFIVKARVINR